MNHYTHRQTCRVCAKTDLACLIDFGQMPLANSFLTSETEFSGERFYPLGLYYCRICGLVQLLDVISPAVLFQDYIYVTGTSDTIAQHNINYACTVVEELQLGKKDLVVEVASNDGSLLKCFQPYGIHVLGIEPAGNIASNANQNGIRTENTFFNLNSAGSILKKYGSARAVIGNNVLAHVDEPRDFLSGMALLVGHNGKVIIEVPYLKELIDRLEYDTIYHEHLSYFSVSALSKLFEKAGLSILKIERIPVHGGSLRISAGSSDVYNQHADIVEMFLDAERKSGMMSQEYFLDFVSKVETNRKTLVGMLQGLKSQGKSIAGYGAPAKGNTLLNYCQISTDLLPYTVDKNPLKVGKLTPGMHIPVLPVETLLEQQPDVVLILAWNFAEEIIGQQEAYRKRGGRFIIPLPEPGAIQ